MKKKIIVVSCLAFLVLLNIIFLFQPVLKIGSYNGTDRNAYGSVELSYVFKDNVCYTTEDYHEAKVYGQNLYRIIKKYGFIGNSNIIEENGDLDRDEFHEADFITKSVFCIKVSDASLINGTAVVIQIFLIIFITINTIYLIKVFK